MDKSDDRVGQLNTILARGGGNLSDPIFKSSKVHISFGKPVDLPHIILN